METFESPKRPRIVFDVDPDFLQAAEQAAERQHVRPRDFYMQAIADAVTPGMSLFVSPTSEKRSSLQAFLEHAQQISMLGVSLTILHDEIFLAFLHQQIVDRKVSMTFLMLDPDLPQDDPLYQFVNRRYSPIHGSEGLHSVLQKTKSALKTLHQAGVKGRVPVRVLALRDYPAIGLTVADAFTRRCRMRVVPYLYAVAGQSLPCLEINLAVERSEEAGLAFIGHLNEVSQAAQLLEF